ncbi:MAG: GNAT family N-acetyltransferase, partial [Pyrinomonadaceae bacterium]|nr:GNAT family N-acetyltransferase [Pyrinomonadaceae bacterium]
EVLDFLAARPVHTVFMAGFIRDNGLESTLNRGSFYAYRDSEGQLEGVALIGHATLVEARSDAALAAFAQLARRGAKAHMIMGEEEKIKRFWGEYAQESEQQPRIVCRELLLEQRWPAEEYEEVAGLRLATLDDLGHVMRVNAEMAYEESGVNPMERDPIGYRMRTARRIEQKRVWVWVEGERLIFKADIVADTPEAIYLEGVYVKTEERGKGYGLRCFSQMCRRLLARTVSICLLVNEENKEAQDFYAKAGYKLQSRYDTIFLPRED